ncbi:MAG: histone deacetylase family protein, partial [Pseudomonadota bacterium]
AASETGDHNNILNIPLAPGTGTEGFRSTYDGMVFPALEDFKPDLLIISAGFDGHEADPLANLNFTDADFEWVTDKLCAIAKTHSRGRVVSCLEGGYDLGALSRAGALHVDALIRAGT